MLENLIAFVYMVKQRSAVHHMLHFAGGPDMSGDKRLNIASERTAVYGALIITESSNISDG